MNTNLKVPRRRVVVLVGKKTNKEVWVLRLLLVLVITLAGWQAYGIHSLEAEKIQYNWKNFNCQVLMEDPVTNAIMCTKWVSPIKKMRSK